MTRDDYDTGLLQRAADWINRAVSAPVDVQGDMTCQRCGKEPNSFSLYFGRPCWLLCKECADESPPPRFRDYYPPHDYWEAAKSEE